ncbi:M15 family metallopeptidase [uncultured Psychrobacter sp.]|uniref:M15 family metallopeptidase n=1 Tax=uncultured Psychrobacter sp. TaxID=259303 RepID=UPI0034590D92
MSALVNVVVTYFMIYLAIFVFTLISVVVIVMLFDRQLCARLFDKLKNNQAKEAVKRLATNKFKGSSIKLVVIGMLPRFKKTLNRLSRTDFSKVSVISALSVLIIAATAGLCYALISNNALEVYHVQDSKVSTANSQINQLLMGERLRPPPPPPEELFAELEAELASYQATQIEEGYWPDTTEAPQAGRALILPEPDLSDLNVQDHTSGYSGDILTSHINNGHINIKNADRNWKKMNSEFVQRLLTVYKVMSDQYGYDMVLLEGYRSPERQARLLKKGSQVTKAGSYKSYHQFGLAGDSAFIRNGKIVISEKDPWAMQGYKLYGKVAKSAGLVWGGDWRMMDLGHVELRKKGVLGRPEMAELLTSQ